MSMSTTASVMNRKPRPSVRVNCTGLVITKLPSSERSRLGLVRGKSGAASVARMRSMTPSSGACALAVSHLSNTSGSPAKRVRKSPRRAGASLVQLRAEMAMAA
ncbi:hypothetical protein D3C87_1816920 [compost metagenome]